MEQQKINWIIIGLVVLFVVWLLSLGSSSVWSGCGLANFGGYGMMGFGYGNFFGSVIMLLSVIVLALAAIWLFRQINSGSRSKGR